MMPGVPVTIRGVAYPSITAAGRALGISTSTVWRHLENGTLDRAGLGQRNAQPYTYAGVTYPSISKAARALGIPGTTFADRVNKGRDPVTGKPAAPAPADIPAAPRACFPQPAPQRMA